MYQNTREKLIFTGLMCGVMVFLMSAFNIILQVGFNWTAVTTILKGFIPIFIIGFLLDLFVLGKFAKAMQSKMVKPDAHIMKKVFAMQFFMVFGMCICMTTLTTFMHFGFTGTEVYQILAITIARNFVVALILQVFVAGPIVRNVAQRIY